MSNLVSSKFASIYQPYKDRHGGAYYELETGFVENKNYGKPPELRITEAKKIPQLSLKKTEEIYSLIRKDIKKLGFLNRPQEYDWLTGLY